MISIVTTLYGSAGHLNEFYTRACAVAERIGDEFEIVMVNDGSPDDSLSIAEQLHATDPRVVVVDLSRNFGHHRAIMVGFEQCRGDRVFLIDCDLEEAPELLEQFVDVLDRSEGCDVVYGVQERRKGGWFERVSGAAFWWLFNKMSRLEMSPNTTTVRLMTRRYVNAVLQFEETEFFLGGILAISGFDQTPLLIEKESRGESTYTLRKKLRMFLEAITSFSEVPLRLIGLLGAIIAMISSVYAIFFVGQKLYYGGDIQVGFTTVVVSIWFLSGLIITFIGVIGVYLSKIYLEVKRRPRAIIRSILRKNAE